MSELGPVTAVVVHYRSKGTIAQLCADLAAQDHPCLDVVVVDCGDDGSVSDALPALDGRPVKTLDPGVNLGYCGGNNRGFASRPRRGDVLVVNPDVRMPDPSTTTTLHRALREHPDLAAVGPAIRTPDGLLEHADSIVDLRRGEAIHSRTHLPNWPVDLPADLHRVPWLDGCCWLLRREALDAVGEFDERFFLICEEVDWSLRATAAGWSLGIVASASVEHARSSSFAATQKGAYYYWRNNYLLFRKHATSRSWRLRWLQRLGRFCLSRRHLRNGAATNALWGGIDALRGRTGPRPGKGRA